MWFQIWIIVAIAGAVIEAVTTQLVSIWFTLSAVINLFLVAAHVSVEIQLIQFLLTGIVLTLIFRPVAKRLSPKFHPMNAADGMIGKNGIVVSQQRVKVDGQSWKFESDKPVAIGDQIKVLALNGVTLKIEKLNAKD